MHADNSTLAPISKTSPATLDNPAMGFAGDLGEVDYWAFDALAASLPAGQKLGVVLAPVSTAELRLSVEGSEPGKKVEVPPNVAVLVPERPGESRRIVTVKVARGLDVNDPYFLAFFTPKAGKPLLAAVRRLHKDGQREEAQKLVNAALALMPNAAWAGKAKELLARPE